MFLLDLHQASPRYVVEPLAAVFEQRAVLIRIIAECGDPRGEIGQILISDPCRLCIRYHNADADRNAFPAEVQQFIVILEVQLFERCQVVNDEHDLRKILPSCFPCMLRTS